MTAHIPFPEGTLVRVKEGHKTEADGRILGSGREFVIDYYASPEESEDGEAFYCGSTTGNGGDVIALPDAIELVMSAEDMAARRPPTSEEIIRELPILGGWPEGFELDELAPHPDGTAEIYGKTDDGLPFGFILTVTGVRQVDF